MFKLLLLKLLSVFEKKPSFEDYMAAHYEMMAVLDRSNRRLFALRMALESVPSIAELSLAPPNTMLCGADIESTDSEAPPNSERTPPVEAKPELAASAPSNVRQNVPKEPETVLEEPENDK